MQVLIEKTHVEAPCNRVAKSMGLEQVKMNPMYSAGWPDRMYLVPGGRPLIIEFKVPGNTTTELQEIRIKYLRENGYDVHVIDTKEKGIALIRSRMGADRVHEAIDEVAPRTPRMRTSSRPRS